MQTPQNPSKMERPFFYPPCGANLGRIRLGGHSKYYKFKFLAARGAKTKSFRGDSEHNPLFSKFGGRFLLESVYLGGLRHPLLWEAVAQSGTWCLAWPEILWP